MKPIDYAKALGAGVLLLALNLTLTTAVIFASGMLLEAVRGPAPYPENFFEFNELATPIANWSAPIGGALLFLAAGWIFTRRKPQRKALQFIAVAWLSYGIVDALLGVPMSGSQAVLQPVFFLHLAVSLAAGLAAATLARPSGAARRGPIRPSR